VAKTVSSANDDGRRKPASGLDWSVNPRWKGIKRPYSSDDVARLRGTVPIEYSLARRGAERLWALLQSDEYIPALGAMTGNQAIQQVTAGLKAIYVSGWQVAADANEASQMYPDQSLYPANSVPHLVRRINQAFVRADQIDRCAGKSGFDWFAPIVADGEAGFGGNLNAFELTKAVIESGAAAIHFEDQLSSAKKCGHLGGKVLVPTREAVQKLTAARLAADVMDVPTLIVARTDAEGAQLLTSDIDPYDHPFLQGDRTVEGFFRIRNGIKTAIARGRAYAPYAELIWCETAKPDLQEARQFAEGILSDYPGKMLAYNCSPSFNWKKNLDESTIKRFQRELAAMGYKFQFITLAGFHALNMSMFDLALSYKSSGMAAYCGLQEREFLSERENGYRAVKHQEFVGTGYFDAVQELVAGGSVSTVALQGSTEAAQFAESSPSRQSNN
jgi:isocitrate lyase